jgi:hypothetical protein
MDYVAQAINKNTGLFGTCTICGSLEDAKRYAKYYRSIGYKSKVFNEEEYTEAAEENKKLYYEQVNLMRQNGIRSN